MARVPLELEHVGDQLPARRRRTSASRSGTRTKTQEEVYVLVGGSARVKLDDEVVELRPVRRGPRAPGHDAQASRPGPRRELICDRRARTPARATREVAQGWWERLTLTGCSSSHGSSRSTFSAGTATASTSTRRRRCAKPSPTPAAGSRGSRSSCPRLWPGADYDRGRALALPRDRGRRGRRASVGGMPASALADEFGTPLVVYCERTIQDAARAYREAAPDALPLYSLKAFPNVALLRLLAAEGFGADVSTLGELAFARGAGIQGERIVVHGNNKSDEELRAAAEAEVRFVVLDALDEVGAGGGGRRARRARARHARDRRGHAREDPHRPRTARSSASRPTRRSQAVSKAREAGLELGGHPSAHRLAAARTCGPGSRPSTGSARSSRARETRSAGSRRWSTSAAASGSATSKAERAAARSRDFVSDARSRGSRRPGTGEPPQVILEPGRSLVGRAGVTLYRVGVVKRASARPDLRGGRRRHVRQPAPAALRRPLQRAAREPRRRGAGAAPTTSAASTASPATS